MVRETYDPFKDESLGRPQPRRRPKMVNWLQAARMLASGIAPEAIAEAIGTDEARIWKHLHKSARFRFLVKQALERQRLIAQLQFAARGSAAILASLGRSESLNGETLQWLAGELGLASSPAPREAGKDLIDQLGDTGFRPRPAADQRQVVESARPDEAAVEMKQNEAVRAPQGASPDDMRTGVQPTPPDMQILKRPVADSRSAAGGTPPPPSGAVAVMKLAATRAAPRYRVDSGISSPQIQLRPT